MLWQLAKEGIFNGDQEITRQMLLDIAETTVDDVPIVLGHYVWDGEESQGWVRHESLETQEIDGIMYLLGQVDLLDNAKQLMLKEYFKNWSVSIAPEEDGRYRLLHLALLGGESPAIPGLKEIAASAKNDKLKCLFFSTNNHIKDNEMNFETKYNELMIEFSKKKEDHTIQLKANVDKVTELTGKVTELEKDGIAKDEKIKEFQEKNFSSSVDALALAMKGKAPKALIDEEIAHYKETGISCSATVERSIGTWSKMPKIQIEGELVTDDNSTQKDTDSSDYTGMTGVK